MRTKVAVIFQIILCAIFWDSTAYSQHPAIENGDATSVAECATCHKSTVIEWKKDTLLPKCRICHSPLRKFGTEIKESGLYLTQKMMRDTIFLRLKYSHPNLELTLESDPRKIAHSLPTDNEKKYRTEVVVTLVDKSGNEVAYIHERLRANLGTELQLLKPKTFPYEISLPNGDYFYTFEITSYPPGRRPVTISKTHTPIKLTVNQKKN